MKDNKPKLKKLTIKQEKFIFEYLKDGNAKRSAIEAGYSIKSARVQGLLLLKNPLVKKEIDKKRSEIAENLALDVQYVLDGLNSIYVRCMEKKPIFDKDGVETGEYTFNPTNARRALRDIGEHLGMFVTKTETEKKSASRLVIMANE